LVPAIIEEDPRNVQSCSLMLTFAEAP